jgi:hypothetical protein
MFSKNAAAILPARCKFMTPETLQRSSELLPMSAQDRSVAQFIIHPLGRLVALE